MLEDGYRMKIFQLDLQWAVTTAIALYGAGLSSYNAHTARKQVKRQINVTISYGCHTYTDGRLGEQMIFLTAANPGHRAVTLTSVGLRLPDGKSLVNVDDAGTARLPHHLTEGTTITQWMPLEGVKESLRRKGVYGRVKLFAYYGDAVGATHKSKPFTIQV